MISIIFDMDGTLLDTQRICIPAWEECGRNQGIEGMGKDIRKVCGMNEIGWTKYIENKYPQIDVLKFKQDVSDFYRKNNPPIRYMNGASELLDYFKGKNIKMAIASGSSSYSVEHHLNEVNAMGYFGAFACGAEVEKGKPEPDVFLLAAERLGVKPETCFVFEDSPLGIIAANKAGMKAIGVPDVAYFSEEIKAECFAVLSSLKEAIPLFKKILKEQ